MSTASAKETRAPIPTRYDVASAILMGVLLIAVMKLNLVAALLAGLLVFQLVRMSAAIMRIPRLTNRYAKMLSVAILAAIVITGLTFAGIGIGMLLRGGPDSLATLLTQLAVIVDDFRRVLPDSVVAYFPPDADAIKREIAGWFREHAAEIRVFGADTLRVIAQMLIGFIIGAMIARHHAGPHPHATPFARALAQRAKRLASAFRRIMLAQVPISAINTVLTAIYLTILLPYWGIHLPFAKTLVVLTFVAGLLPVVGNLISNTAIFMVSLSHSFGLALVSLGYLIVIHKLEYFLNARIVGTRIKAKAWEILIALLLLESIFGIPGLVMAPLTYAYIKYELMERGLI